MALTIDEAGDTMAKKRKSMQNRVKQSSQTSSNKGKTVQKADIPLSQKLLSFKTVILLVAAGILVGFGIGFVVGHFVEIPLPTPSSNADDAETTGADSVAAQVGDVTIMESEVTDYIETNMRVDATTGETMSDEEWVSYLESYGWTPETLREAVIRNVLTMPSVIVTEAANAGIVPDENEIETQLNAQKESVGEDGWADWLAENGFRDEAAYVLSLQADAVYDELMETNASFSDPTQDEIDAYIESSASAYAGQRVSLIYLPYGEEGSDDIETARGKADDVIARLTAGEDFASLADEYNAAGMTDAGGDIGWGSASSLPEVCTTALATMSIDSFSDILDDGSAFFIVKVTDEYVLPEDGTVDLASVPESVKTLLSEQLALTNQSDAENTYYNELVESTLVSINPMPEGLPYDVDMSASSE
ncbi:MAG: peptidylprolyl isomerase [Coriobacteriales bacterium]|jgi:foldase protein PrsA|nr:peptidylprolyl isomerase [Coriobacteriales bacterium]